MKVLVTGGSGYIGSHIILELIKHNHEFIIYDNFTNSSRNLISRLHAISGKDINFHEGDICNQDELDILFSNNKFDAVIHLAGLKAISESIEDPLQYYYNNVYGSIVLLKCMAKHNVKNIVFSSSATVYGNPKSLPITETTPLQKPKNPYGSSKLMVEEILNDLYLSDKNWSIFKLRYFNPVGADKSGDIGEDPINVPNNIMPLILEVAAGQREKLYIFGDSYNTKDGTGIRDYIHISDLAAGHIKALEKTLKNKGVHAINLGTGNGYSVLELVKTFESVTGIKIPYKISDKRDGDVAECYADSSLAKEFLDWEAHKDLSEMCKDSWKWKMKNPNGYD